MLSLYSSLPFLAQEILMTSHSDVIIVCSFFLVGKPLCMHTQTAIVHLQMHQCPRQNPLQLQKLQTLSSIFLPLFHACDTLPQVFQCTLILESSLLTFSKHRLKQG